MQSSDTSEIGVPTTVTIPAASSFVEFDVLPVDDALLDGTQAVSLSANSAGYRSASAALSVTDAELLTLSLDRLSISENGGTAQATVQRSNTDTALPLTVTVSSSDNTEATVPGTVTIPAGQRSVTFAINAVDDTLLDGTQVVRIQAQAAGYLDSSSAQSTLSVLDAESLSLTIDRTP